MQEHTSKNQAKKNRAVANQHSPGKSGRSESKFADQRPEVIQLGIFQEMADESPRSKELVALQKMAENSPQAQNVGRFQAMVNGSRHSVAQRALIEGVPGGTPQSQENREEQENQMEGGPAPIQRQHLEGTDPLQRQIAPVRPKPEVVQRAKVKIGEDTTNPPLNEFGRRLLEWAASTAPTFVVPASESIDYTTLIYFTCPVGIPEELPLGVVDQLSVHIHAIRTNPAYGGMWAAMNSFAGNVSIEFRGKEMQQEIDRPKKYLDQLVTHGKPQNPTPLATIDNFLATGITNDEPTPFMIGDSGSIFNSNSWEMGPWRLIASRGSNVRNLKPDLCRLTLKFHGSPIDIQDVPEAKYFPAKAPTDMATASAAESEPETATNPDAAPAAKSS